MTKHTCVQLFGPTGREQQKLVFQDSLFSQEITFLNDTTDKNSENDDWNKIFNT